MNLAGSVTAGTSSVALSAAGTISQSGAAKIVGASLSASTSVGNVALDTCPTNNVATLVGGNTALNGSFAYSDADGLDVAGVSTNDGAITVVGGGAVTVSKSVSAGNGLITLQASGGITGLVAPITSTRGLQLANTTSGNITLSSANNLFPELSAVSASGTTITIFDGQDVILVNNGRTAGLSVAGGTIVLTVLGGVDQALDAPVIADAATFVVQGDVTLDVSVANDVSTLAVENTGAFAKSFFTDTNDITIGVGTKGMATLFGDIKVVSLTGAITLNANVSNGGGASTTLTANGGSITQPAGTINSRELIMNSSFDIVVTQAGNTISNLRAFAANNLRYVNAEAFEVGLDRNPVDPQPLTNPGAPVTVAVTDNVAVFSQTFNVAPPRRALEAGDVLVIADVPYRVKAVSGLTATLISPSGVAANFPAGTAFQVLTPQLTDVGATDVNLNSVRGNVRVTAGIGASVVTITAGKFVQYVVTSTENAKPGSLRQMINYVNDNQGTRTVNGVVRPQPMQMVFNEFDYPVQDIFITSALPAIQKPVDILGASVEAHVTDYARVGVDGTGLTATSIVNGLRYAAGSQGSTASGLSVYGFATGAGVQVVSGLNTFTNNYVGVRRDGTTISSNKIGFELTGATSTTNTIGTYVVDESQANVIGGNAYGGVVVRSGATANAIVGNYVGTDSLGNNLGNLGDGIVFEGVNGNLVGTRNAVLPDGTPAASNVIANNNNSGIRIINARAATAALGNVIENNRIDANAVNGIEITASTFQSIGGSQPRQANVITGQLTGSGVRIAQSVDVSVVANYIGVNAAGTPNLGNAASGVLVDGSLRTLVNGGNRIASNGTGVTVRNGSVATRVEGNWIGTDSAGNVLGNLGDGVLIDRSIGNFVRAGNTIANNRTNGVNITDSVASTPATGNFVTGNVITGNGNIGTGTGAGVRVSGGAGHTIGQAGAGNVITANVGEGIRVERSTLTGSSANIRIVANYVGTNTNQETDPALGNGLGIRLSQAASAAVTGQNVVINNLSDGVRLEGTSGALVGGTTSGAGNVISGNGGNGVTITDAVPGVTSPMKNSGNSVFGNQISGNTGSGVYVKGVTTNGASTTANVLVGVSAAPGKPATGAANVISENGGAGVTVDGAQGVLVSGNSIYDNVGLPIQIVNDGNRGAVTPNLTRAVLVQNSNSVPQAVISGTFAREGAGTVTVVNGTATFSVAQTTLQTGAVVVINGVGYSVTQKVSSTVFRLAGNATVTTAGNGKVTSKNGVATFSATQSPSLQGQTIIVAGRSYTVTSLSANGRSARLAGAPTFNVSAFATASVASFSLVDASLVNQQYVVDVFLNQPADGNPATGSGYGMRTFLGRATVTIGPTGTGAFSLAVNLPSGTSSVGQYVTATATTVRASADVSAFSTSQVSPKARQLVFAAPGA